MLNYKKSATFNQLDKEFENITKKLEKIEFPKGFLDFLLYTVSELFANIKEHSKAKRAFLLIKLLEKNCLIEVSDNGIGLRKSYLLKKIYPKNDFSAIEFALSGLSTKDPTERGFGLYTIRKFIEALGGKMVITSGLASSSIKRNRVESKKLTKPIEGTKIYLETEIKKLDFYKLIE